MNLPRRVDRRLFGSGSNLPLFPRTRGQGCGNPPFRQRCLGGARGRRSASECCADERSCAPFQSVDRPSWLSPAISFITTTGSMPSSNVSALDSFPNVSGSILSRAGASAWGSTTSPPMKAVLLRRLKRLAEKFEPPNVGPRTAVRLPQRAACGYRKPACPSD